MDKFNFSVYSPKKRYLEVVYLDPSKLKKKNDNLMAVGSRTLKAFIFQRLWFLRKLS
jgi:hypothetical protein